MVALPPASITARNIPAVIFINLRSDLDENAVYPTDNNANQEPHESAEQLVADDASLIPLALAAIPNEDVPQPEYNRIGMAFLGASQGSEEGFQAFDAWAQEVKKVPRRYKKTMEALF